MQHKSPLDRTNAMRPGRLLRVYVHSVASVVSHASFLKEETAARMHVF